MSDFARRTAEILIETGCVLFRPEDPFTLTSGKSSPVYVDCRRLIAFVEPRRQVMRMGYDLLCARTEDDVPFDCVAGGETAGIAYAAWLAEQYQLPMAYIRKKPKGFGKNARIEGDICEGQNVLLVEDLFTDGGSKLSFLDAIAEAGAQCRHCFTIFRYGIFPDQEQKFFERGVTLHALASWQDVIGVVKNSQRLDRKQIAAIEAFLHNPDEWTPPDGEN